MKNGTLSGFHGEGHMMNALGGQSLLTHFPVFLIIFYVIFFFLNSDQNNLTYLPFHKLLPI